MGTPKVFLKLISLPIILIAVNHHRVYTQLVNSSVSIPSEQPNRFINSHHWATYSGVSPFNQKAPQTGLDVGHKKNVATSRTVSECAMHDHSECVVNSDWIENCTCIIDLFLDNDCVVSPNMVISLSTANELPEPSERLIPYEVWEDTQIRIYVQENDANEYNLFCTNEDNSTHRVHYTQIHVGYPPLDVQNFSCISYNWEKLICRWEVPKNPAQGNDPYKPYLNVSTSDEEFECGDGPGCLYTGDGVTGATKDCCYWNTDLGYRPNDPSLSMLFVVTNTLVDGNVEFWKPIDYLGDVIPNPPENLSAVSSAGTEITIEWSTPGPLVSFPGDLIYRIDHRVNSTYDRNATWYPPRNGSCSSAICNTTLEVPYPGMKYEVQVRLRSGARKNQTLEDDSWWSNKSIVDVESAPTRPWTAPSIAPGSFEVQMHSIRTSSCDLIVEWQRMHFTQFNGPDFHYVIRLTYEGNETIEQTVRDLDAFVIFVDMPLNSYFELEITSANSEGESNVSSTQNISSTAEKPSLPTLPAVIYHTNLDLYELKWQGGKDLQYTIYLCFDAKTSNNPCHGDLYWKQVGDVTTANVTFADFNAMQPSNTSPRFAISAEDAEVRSSGMNWDCCVRPQPYQIPGAIQPLIYPINEKSSSSALIRWDVSCAGWGSVIDTVRLEYCPGNNDFSENCTVSTLDSPVITSATDCLNNVTILGLKSNMTYSVWLTLIFRGGQRSMQSLGRAFVTSAVVTDEGLQPWAITLIVCGSIVAVVILLIIIRFAVREWKRLKKSLNQEPQVPVGLLPDVGGFLQEPATDKRFQITKMDSQIKENTRSTVHIEDEMKGDTISIISNLFKETVGECFKNPPQTPDEVKSLLTQAGHVNNGYESPTLKFFENSPIPNNETSEPKINITDPTGKDDVTGLSSHTSNGYVRADAVLVPSGLPLQEGGEALGLKANNGYVSAEDFSILTTAPENKENSLINDLEYKLEKAPIVDLSTEYEIIEKFSAPTLSPHDANSKLKGKSTNESDRPKLEMQNPKPFLSTGYVALDDGNTNLISKTGTVNAPTAESSQTFECRNVDDANKTNVSKTGYVSMGDAKRMHDKSTPFPGFKMNDISLSTKCKSGYVSIEDASNMKNNSKSDTPMTEDISNSINLKTQSTPGYVSLEDAQNVAAVAVPEKNVNTKFSPGYVSIEEAKVFSEKNEPAPTKKYDLPDYKSPDTNDKPGYVSIEYADKLEKAKRSATTEFIKSDSNINLSGKIPSQINEPDTPRNLPFEQSLNEEKLSYGYSRVSIVPP